MNKNINMFQGNWNQSTSDSSVGSCWSSPISLARYPRPPLPPTHTHIRNRMHLSQSQWSTLEPWRVVSGAHTSLFQASSSPPLLKSRFPALSPRADRRMRKLRPGRVMRPWTYARSCVSGNTEP